MALAVGYDGSGPAMREPRDLAGHAARSLPTLQNSNCDRLEWLLSHGKIEQYQLDAGRRLEADCQLAQIGGYVSGGNGCRAPAAASTLSDAKLDAIARVGRARSSLVPTAWRLLDLVVLQNIALCEAGRRLWGKSGRGEPLGALRFALDGLAAHYGILTVGGS
jgi:hypothetical protein